MKKSLSCMMAALLVALPCAGLAACNGPLPESPYGVWTGETSYSFEKADSGVTRLEVTVAEGEKQGEIDCVLIATKQVSDRNGRTMSLNEGLFLQLTEETGKAGSYAAGEFSLDWSEEKKTLALSLPGEQPLTLSYSPLPAAPVLPEGEYWGIVDHDVGLRISLGNGKVCIVGAPEATETSLRTVGGYEVAVFGEEAQCILKKDGSGIFGYLSDLGEGGSSCGVSFSKGTMPEGPYHHFVNGKCSECNKQQEKGEVSYDYENAVAVDITITSGKVDMRMDMIGIVATSVEYDADTNTYVDKTASTTATGQFFNGGTYTFKGSDLTLKNLVPGDTVKIKFRVYNAGSIGVKYCIRIECTEGQQSFSALAITADEKPLGSNSSTEWTDLAFEEQGTVEFTLKVPIEALNVFTDACKITFSVFAVQSNAHTEG